MNQDENLDHEAWAVPPGAGSTVPYAAPASAPAADPFAVSPSPLPRSPGRRDGFSITALVFGMLPLFPLAVPLGIVGLVRTRGGVRTGRSFAIAGLVLSALWIFGLAVLLIVARLPGGFTTYSHVCAHDACDVTVRGDQVMDLIGHEVEVSEIGAGRATFTVDGDSALLRVGEPQRIGDGVVNLTSVAGDVAEFSIDFAVRYASKSDLEKLISDWLAAELQAVTCPEDLRGEQGVTMQCEVAEYDGSTRVVTLTVTGVEGEEIKFDILLDEEPGSQPPTSTGGGPATADEVEWLQAVERLLPTMNSAFENSPIDLTTADIRDLAYELRSCSRELARVGSASPRLQPVEALVDQACQEYDHGADCLDEAASMGVPEGSAGALVQEQLIQCGFDASDKGGAPLVEALMKADEVYSGGNWR